MSELSNQGRHAVVQEDEAIQPSFVMKQAQNE